MLKFSVNDGIMTIRSTILTPTECTTITATPKDHVKKAEEHYEKFRVAIHPDFPDQEIIIGGAVSIKARTEPCTLLKRNLDIFAWQTSDMTGVPRSIAEHRLNIREGYSPVRQKTRAGLRARQSNPSRDLNKACPQDCYPLPEIDWKVESLCGYPFKCFLDAYKDYHQILMAEQDKEKTSFHTSHGVYCYTKMPFGLKNVGVTYQRLVDQAFDKQIDPNLEIYVDDLVIKSHTETELLRDIEETFRTLRKINIKLNPKKYTFGAAEGMFLGYMINPEGIKPCPDKTRQRPCYNSHLHEQSKRAISAVLITEMDTIQTPVYFVSRVMHAPELNYTPMEKLVMALVCAAKRLRRYFQAHPIVVITDQPIKQILAVFLVERPDDSPPEASVIKTPQDPWTLFTNGSSCVDGSGDGLILTSLEGTEFTYALRFQFAASNNEAEYEALIAFLRIATQIGVHNVHASSLISGFDNFSISQVPRSKNKKADAPSTITSTSFAHLSKQVLVEVLKEKYIQEEEVATVVKEGGPTWMTPIMEYLKDGTLTSDRKEASELRIKARQYELWEGVLYKRSFLKLWLRCVGPLQADYVIREIHEGSCSMHAGPRTVVAKAMRLGYYWPTMHRDARDMLRTCNAFPVHRLVLRNPQQPLNPITAPCTFYKWGIDIAGPFPEGPGKLKFLIVAMDLFTKWIEAKSVATITGGQVKKFVWDNIVCRFGLLGEIISNNEAVIPAKIRMPTYRTVVVDVVHNTEELRLNLDLLEERRECAAIREAKAKVKMTKYYNTWVRGVAFRPGDFFYRSNQTSHAMEGGKLGPKWEGPYEVTEVLGDGAYRLRSRDGAVLLRTWNVANLKKCYL
nr:reverse transcriptase domain-containing protein [Tanacetum cinerariifolium]